MSRYIDHNPDTNEISEVIASMDECKDLVNEVCTNPNSDQCCDYPHSDYCKCRCPYFTDEDGKTTA